MTTQTTISAYSQAHARVTMDNDLAPYADICLYDWTEGDEHWNWIVDAPSREIVEWAQTIRENEESN